MKFYREDKYDYFYCGKIISNKLNACYNRCNSIIFYKNGKQHNPRNASYIDNIIKAFYLNGNFYGYKNDFTKESWRKFVKLQVFL